MTESLRIAIAEDEPIALQDLQESVMELGHQVVTAVSDGQALIDGCRETQPDLVITDIKMPGVDGLAAAMAIGNERPTPVIVVSAYHDPEFIERAEGDHVLAYLVKPLRDGSLATSISIAMRRWREFQALREQAESLQQAMQERKLIERAKGILMRRGQLTEEVHLVYI
ncbi:MAG: response regulator, partial [Planctomycetota bacterium]